MYWFGVRVMRPGPFALTGHRYSDAADHTKSNRHAENAHRHQNRCHHRQTTRRVTTSRAGRPKHGKSRTSTVTLSWDCARTPQSAQPTRSRVDSMVITSSCAASHTSRTRNPSRPSRVCAKPVSSITVRGPFIESCASRRATSSWARTPMD